jgi:hypothetical protein
MCLIRFFLGCVQILSSRCGSANWEWCCSRRITCCCPCDASGCPCWWRRKLVEHGVYVAVVDIFCLHQIALCKLCCELMLMSWADFWIFRLNIDEFPLTICQEDDDDLDLFGDETEEEKAAAEAREAEKKKSTKPKVIGKSSIVMDVKPWDDETDMVKLEECVRAVQMEGLHWGACKSQQNTSFLCEARMRQFHLGWGLYWYRNQILCVNVFWI